MKKLFTVLVIFSLILLLTPAAFATNGDNLIGVGPISRAMGGVGIAQPMDAISAVFANPAAMCFGEYCPGSEFNFSGTLFMPKVEAKVTNAGTPGLTAAGTFSADSEDNIYPIPAIGFSVPISSEPKNWRFGLAAYGVTGLGVDYRDTSIDNSTYYPAPPFPAPGAPLISGDYTQLQIMKFAPSIAFQPSQNFSAGLAVHINYGNLDLKNGGSSGFAFGLQPGIIFKPIDNLSLGLTYVSAQKITHKNVTDFDQDGTDDDLDLESPQQLGLGLAYDFFGAGLLVEGDVKWINWSDADGYQEFDWDDQWVLAIGARYKATDKLTLRIGYNYGENPVKEHPNFNGLTTTTVQGKTLPSTYYYETFRIIGFPAIVEHHITAGIGYKFTDSFSLDLGFVYAVENSISESGTDPFGTPVTIESTLSETSLDFGLTYRF
ncbi:MAG: outer membrane protein transport protein [Deltaproteobacteria bacterium]|jgi:long-chain fatty acid transport protein|nr:outer membrane protein transport protein [Deltaproteobacteria bacterium]